MVGQSPSTCTCGVVLLVLPFYYFTHYLLQETVINKRRTHLTIGTSFQIKHIIYTGINNKNNNLEQQEEKQAGSKIDKDQYIVSHFFCDDCVVVGLSLQFSSNTLWSSRSCSSKQQDGRQSPHCPIFLLGNQLHVLHDPRFVRRPQSAAVPVLPQH